MYIVSIISIIICIINFICSLFLERWVESYVWAFSAWSWIIVYIGEREIKKLKKENIELEKYGIWQNKKYETWRGYMNKGYRIANTFPAADNPPTYNKLIFGKLKGHYKII